MKIPVVDRLSAGLHLAPQFTLAIHAAEGADLPEPCAHQSLSKDDEIAEPF